MRRSLWLACGMGLCLAVSAAGCSGGDDDDDGNAPGGSPTTPAQACSNVAFDTCEKIFSCTTEEQRRSLGVTGDSLACTSRAIQQLGCTSASPTCAGTQAATCSSQVKGASCSDVSSKQVSAYASGCGPCAIRP